MSLENMRNAEIASTMHLAQEHSLRLDPSDIEFSENGHLPYIEGQDAEDYIQQLCGCGGECLI